MRDGGAEGDGWGEWVGVRVDDFVAALFAFAWGGLVGEGTKIRGRSQGW